MKALLCLLCDWPRYSPQYHRWSPEQLQGTLRTARCGLLLFPLYLPKLRGFLSLSCCKEEWLHRWEPFYPQIKTWYVFTLGPQFLQHCWMHSLSWYHHAELWSPQSSSGCDFCSTEQSGIRTKQWNCQTVNCQPSKNGNEPLGPMPPLSPKDFIFFHFT